MFRYALSRDRVSIKPLFMRNCWKNGYRNNNSQTIRTINQFDFCTATGLAQPAVANVEPIKKKWHKRGDFCSSSLDALVNLSWFVDRTLLIERLFSDQNRHIIFGPSRSGKSAMIGMVKLFLKCHVDENGNIDIANNPNRELFTNLKIASNTELMEKHFGKYPVIHLDLKSDYISDTTSKGVLGQIRYVIHRAYRSHSYLQESKELFNGKYKTSNFEAIFRMWINGIEYKNIPEKDVLKGLAQLVEMLHIHHNTKCWILVDEYDSMVNSALGRIAMTELSDICDLKAETFGVLFNGEWSDEHVAGGIITGVSFLSEFRTSQALNNIKPKCYPKVHEFTDFLGLNEQEVRTLFQKLGMEEFVDEALYHFDGYVGNNNVTLYDSFSVFMCLLCERNVKYKRISGHWNANRDVLGIETAVKIDSVRNQIYRLIAGQSISLKLPNTLTMENLEELNNFLSRDNKNLNSISAHTVLNLMAIQGCLKIDKVENPNQDMYSVSMPNRNMRKTFASNLAKYYRQANYKEFSNCQHDLEVMLRKLNENKIEQLNEDVIKENVLCFLNSFHVLLCKMFRQEPNFEEFHLQTALAMLFRFIDDYSLKLLRRINMVDDKGCQTLNTQSDIFISGLLYDVRRNRTGSRNNGIVFVMTCTGTKADVEKERSVTLEILYKVREVPKEFQYCESPKLNQLDEQEKIRVGNIIENLRTFDVSTKESVESSLTWDAIKRQN